MRAALLCAGTSSRMSPLGEKFLFEYLGKSILQHRIDILLEHNINDIYIITNEENNKKIKKHLDEKYPNNDFIYTIQSMNKGMIGGVLTLKGIIRTDKPLLLQSPNDVVENFFWKDFFSHYKAKNPDIFICGKKVKNYFPGGYLEIDGEKNVKKIIEKPTPGNEPSDLINLVIHIFKNPQILLDELNKIPTNIIDDGYEKALQNLFNQGKKALYYEYTGKWNALKYPWDHLDMMESFFKNHLQTPYISSESYIAPSAVINGNVYIESGVKVLDQAVINGPAYIGKGSIIGNHTLVRGSIIGEKCIIGQGTEIARSYLRNNISTHQAYIGDSVLDNDINIGAGTRTGNLRFDEGEIHSTIKGVKISSGKNKLGVFCGSGVRIGINTSFMPGVQVGKNSHISAGMCISQNIPKKSFVKEKRELDIRENKF